MKPGVSCRAGPGQSALGSWKAHLDRLNCYATRNRNEPVISWRHEGYRLGRTSGWFATTSQVSIPMCTHHNVVAVVPGGRCVHRILKNSRCRSGTAPPVVLAKMLENKESLAQAPFVILFSRRNFDLRVLWLSTPSARDCSRSCKG